IPPTRKMTTMSSGVDVRIIFRVVILRVNSTTRYISATRKTISMPDLRVNNLKQGCLADTGHFYGPIEYSKPVGLNRDGNFPGVTGRDCENVDRSVNRGGA